MNAINVPLTLSREVYYTFKKIVEALKQTYTKSEIDVKIAAIEARLDAGGL
jgi:hypothetical protein